MLRHVAWTWVCLDVGRLDSFIVLPPVQHSNHNPIVVKVLGTHETNHPPRFFCLSVSLLSLYLFSFTWPAWQFGEHTKGQLRQTHFLCDRVPGGWLKARKVPPFLLDSKHLLTCSKLYVLQQLSAHFFRSITRCWCFLWVFKLFFPSQQWVKSQVSGLVSTMRLWGCWFNPRPGHTKDFTNGSCCLPAGWPELGGLAHPVIAVHGTAAAHRSNRGWVKCGGQISYPSGCDNHWDLNLLNLPFSQSQVFGSV